MFIEIKLNDGRDALFRPEDIASIIGPMTGDYSVVIHLKNNDYYCTDENVASISKRITELLKQ